KALGREYDGRRCGKGNPWGAGPRRNRRRISRHRPPVRPGISGVVEGCAKATLRMPLFESGTRLFSGLIEHRLHRTTQTLRRGQDVVELRLHVDRLVAVEGELDPDWLAVDGHRAGLPGQRILRHLVGPDADRRG